MTETTIKHPSREVLDFLRWAAGAAVSEYYTSATDETDYRAALAWLDEIQKLCGYE